MSIELASFALGCWAIFNVVDDFAVSVADVKAAGANIGYGYIANDSDDHSRRSFSFAFGFGGEPT